MKLSLRHTVPVFAGLLLVPNLALAQGDAPPAPAPEPAPAPAPAASAEETKPAESGPTVTLGPAPARDTAAKEESKAEEAKKEEPKLFWAGTALTSQLSMSTTSLARQQQLTTTDLVESWFLFTPRITINKSWTVRGRFTLTYELTDTSATSTTTRNEPQFGDSIAYVDYTNIPEIPKLGIKPKVTATIGFPTSKASIQRTQIFSPGIGGGLSKTFEKVGKGSVQLSASATWSHPVYSYTTGGTWDNQSPLPFSPSCYLSAGAESGACGGQASGSGAPNPENIIASLFTVGGEWPLGKGTIKPSSFMFFINTWDYQLSQRAGVGTLSDYGMQPANHFKQSTFFGLALDYDFWGSMRWLGAEVGYYMFRGLMTGDGKIGNPFFDTAQDMRVYVAANIAFDELYLSLAGKGAKPEAPPGAKGKGVVRASPLQPALH